MIIGIVGAGTMGNGIAHIFSLYDNKVFLVDISMDVLYNSYSMIKENMNRQCKKSIINNQKMTESLKNIHLSTEIKDLKDCDLVIEAVKEDFEIKSNVFKKLDIICKKETIFASNTSSISITKLGEKVSRPKQLIGMHFMNPVPIMKLIEVINGEKTSEKTCNFIMELSNKIDKIPVQCNDSPGFVSNRILMPMINEAAYCLMEKVGKVEDIDSIMKLGMGHPMGPLKLADLIGIDVCVYILNILYDGFNDAKYKACPLLVDMIKDNKLGKKTKEGFYSYEF